MAVYGKTDRVIVLDIDGNRLAIFGGYDAPSPSEIFAHMESATRVFVYNRHNEIKETYWR